MNRERPECEFGELGGCHNKAMWLCCFGDTHPSSRYNHRPWFVSCDQHVEKWRNRGLYMVGLLHGWCSDPGMSDTLKKLLSDEPLTDIPNL